MSPAEEHAAERSGPDAAPTREFVDGDGKRWTAVAEAAVVAHGKQGAVLAFRPSDQPDSPTLRTTITFNSRAAAAFALRTLGDKELRRRLMLAQSAAAGP